MKRARQTEILNIIQSVDVETQEQLLDELRPGAIPPPRPRFPGTSRSCGW